jgi:hypothetical protein
VELPETYELGYEEAEARFVALLDNSDAETEDDEPEPARAGAGGAGA